MVSIKAILLGVASTLVPAFALGPDWKALYTECMQISYDGNLLCLSNYGGTILCSNREYDGIPTWNVRQAEYGQVHNARVWGEYIYALTVEGEVQVTASNGGDTWHTLPGSIRFKQLSVDGKQMCGVDFSGNLYCADDEITSNPNWRKLPGTFTQVDITDGVLYAVDASGQLKYGFSDSAQDWKDVPGVFQQVSYDGGIICGITPGNALLCATEGLPTSPRWQHYEGAFTFVEVQAGRVYAIEDSTMVYVRYFTAPPNVMDDNWTALRSAPRLRQINFDGRTLVGAATDEGVWIATGGFDNEPNWFKIDGMLKHVVVWGDRLYGVNSENMVWTGLPSQDPQWKRLEGKYKQLSADGKQLCAVTDSDEIFCADTLIDREPNWRRIDGSLQHIVVLNGVLTGTNAVDGSVWVGYSHGDPQWRKIPNANLRNLEYDGITACGTNIDGDIFCADSGFLDGAPNARQLEGKAVYTAVNSGRVFAITSDYALYTRTDL